MGCGCGSGADRFFLSTTSDGRREVSRTEAQARMVLSAAGGGGEWHEIDPGDVARLEAEGVLVSTG